MTNSTEKRELPIDFLKAIAIFGVIVIHSCSAGYRNPLGSFEWCSAVLWGSITRGSVPIFLMCSGALLLDPQRELPMKKLYGKNILRLLVAMFFWAMFYKCFHLVEADAFSIMGLYQSVKEVLLFQQEFHFYYIHMMLLVYVFLPVTRVFVKHVEKRQLEYALAIWFIVGILYPTVKPFWPFRLLSGMAPQWHLNMTYASIGYGMLGYYLKHYPFPKWMGWSMFLAGSAFTFGATCFMSFRHGFLYTNFLEGMSLGPAVIAAGLFVLGISYSTPCPKACVFLSKASFCIYLVHVFFMDLFKNIGFTLSFLPCFLSIPAYALCVLAPSCLTYFVLSRIPVVKKYLI